MEEPAVFGGTLLGAIAPAPHTGARLYRLGQAGIVARFPGATVYVDLYLSNHCEAVLPRPFDHRRATRAPLDPAEITDADIIVCTHDHLDHLDPPTIRTLRDASPRAVLVLPHAAANLAAELDWPQERIVRVEAGESVTIAGVTLDAFAVAHDDVEFVLGHDRFLGFAIRGGGVTIGHVGDARATPELADALRRADCDLVFLPVNGRSPERAAMGFAGNMSATEAVDLAIAAGAPHVVPMHYDMFPQNTDTDAIAVFESTAGRQGLSVEVVRIGEPIVVAPRSITP